MWSFVTFRTCAIEVFNNRFGDEEPFQRLHRAFECSVPRWIKPAYDQICRRMEPLTAEEGQHLGWERFSTICAIREKMARGDLVVAAGDSSYLQDLSWRHPGMARDDSDD